MSELSQTMAQMGNENRAFGQAIGETPPQLTQSNPTLDDLGLSGLKMHLSENGYNTLLTMLHWAVVCQKLSDGDSVRWTHETYATMQAPFVGFGNPFLWESTYANNIGKILHAHFLNWHTKGSKYRREHRLPHIILTEIAPLMANQAKGWQHMQYIQDMVMDPDFARYL